MKRLLTLILTIGMSSSSSFAYINGKEAREETALYCPEQIECIGTLPIYEPVCKINSEFSKYISKVKGKASGVNMMFSFSSASTSFHSNQVYASCKYLANKNDLATYVELTIKSESNLEAFYKKLSSWIFAGQGATCASSTATSCPLKERNGFVLYNLNISEGIFASIQEKDISDLIRSSIYYGVIYDHALVGCSSVKECTIDILSAKHVKYGSVKVDMDTMKILKIDSVYPAKIQLNKIDPFNSIEISYLSK